jgi:hypothetical protein
MSISGVILAGFSIGLILVGVVILSCRADLRRAQGKTVRPGLRRYMPTRVLLALGGNRVMVPEDRKGRPLSDDEMQALNRAAFMLSDHAATASVAGAQWAAESMMREYGRG